MTMNLAIILLLSKPLSAQVPPVSRKAIAENSPAIVCKGDIFRDDYMRSPRVGMKKRPRKTSYKVELAIYFDWSKYSVEAENGIESRVHQATVEERITDYSQERPATSIARHAGARLRESPQDAYIFIDRLGLTLGAELDQPLKQSSFWIFRTNKTGLARNLPDVPPGTARKDEEFARIRQALYYRYADIDCEISVPATGLLK